MRRKTNRIILLALVCINLVFPQHQAQAEDCPTYNFQSIFFEDYYPGTKWDNRSGNRNITWSATASVILDESITRGFTNDEMGWLREAFQSWDDALDSVRFTEVSSSAQPEITIGYVTLNQPNAWGYWNSWWINNFRYKATIKIKDNINEWLGVKNQFIHLVQHELGNALGLGDIKPTAEFASTQEDSLQPPFGSIPLSDFDTGMMRQLYGESTCPSTFPTAAKKIAAEQKAKQEAEAKLAAELKAKQEAEAKLAAELKAKQEAEAKALADAAAQKIIQEDFNLVMSDYERLMLRIKSLKLKFPRVSNLLAIEEKLLGMPIILGDDLNTAKYNIQSVNTSLDSSEKIWAKTQKTTITCVKGKISKKLTAINPKCPAGYKKK